MNINDKSYDETCTTALFRIVQELLTNITRHANASKIDFSLHERRKTIELTVADNGRGITNAEVCNPESFGLLGIKERARSLGGSADFKSHSGKGTTVKVTIPRKQEPEKQ
jgi:signal transduction histidine kinase